MSNIWLNISSVIITYCIAPPQEIVATIKQCDTSAGIALPQNKYFNFHCQFRGKPWNRENQEELRHIFHAETWKSFVNRFVGWHFQRDYTNWRMKQREYYPSQWLVTIFVSRYTSSYCLKVVQRQFVWYPSPVIKSFYETTVLTTTPFAIRF